MTLKEKCFAAMIVSVLLTGVALQFGLGFIGGSFVFVAFAFMVAVVDG